jgi:uncharacterized membrane protein (DUF441 family)
MKDLYFILIAWSITSILVNGTIFDRLRVYLLIKAPTLHKLFSCMQCSGFWVGIILGILATGEIIYNPLGDLSSQPHNFWISYPLTTIAYGFLSSGVSVLLNSLVVFFYSFSGKE